MPNTFLDSYFKGREEKLQRDQLAQQAAAQQAQLAFSQQQLAQQAGQFEIQQGFERTQAADRTRLAEAQLKQQQAQQLLSNQLGIGQAVGAGQLKQVPMEANPLFKSLGLPGPPPAAGQFDFGGQHYAPTSVEDRATQAREAKSLDAAAEQKAQLDALMEGFSRAEQAGAKFDPELKGMLTFANLMPNMNAVGLLNKLPKKFEEIGAHSMDAWGNDLVEQAVKNPASVNDPNWQRSKANFETMVKVFKPLSANSIPGGNALIGEADKNDRYLKTSRKFTQALAEANISSQDPQKARRWQLWCVRWRPPSTAETTAVRLPKKSWIPSRRRMVSRASAR